MNQLSKLQNTFQRFVLDANTTDSIAWVSASGRAAPETQVSIYTHAYTARLLEVMGNDYPAVLMALGEDLFNTLVTEYIKTHPSHYFSLREFGNEFPAFISEQIKVNTQFAGMYWLYELALFEWSLGHAFDAADLSLFTVQDMASIPPESWPELRFTLHPSVSLLEFEWNTPEMWHALTDDNPQPVTAQREPLSSWLIWREELTTRFRSMQTDEQIALKILANGENFNALCETLSTIMDEEAVPLHAATLLKGWITHGLIIGIQ